MATLWQFRKSMIFQLKLNHEFPFAFNEFLSGVGQRTTLSSATFQATRQQRPGFFKANFLNGCSSQLPIYHAMRITECLLSDPNYFYQNDVLPFDLRNLGLQYCIFYSIQPVKITSLRRKQWLKLVELFLLPIFVLADYFRQKHPRLQLSSRIALLSLNILIATQPMDSNQPFLMILALVDPTSSKAFLTLKLLNLVVIAAYLSLYDFGQGQPLVLSALIAMYLCAPRESNQHQIRRSEQTFEETIQIRPSSETDRFLDPQHNLVSVMRLNHQLRLTFTNNKAQEILASVKLNDLLDASVYQMDKKTKQFLSEVASYRVPSVQEFRESGQFFSLREIVNHIFTNSRLPYEFQIFSLGQFRECYLKVVVQDIKTCYVVMLDLREYNESVKKLYTQTTMQQIFKSFSHEFNTSLNYILALAQVAECKDTVARDIQERFFHPIVCTGKIMHSIVSDIMDYNLILGKTFNLQVTNFSITELVSEVMQLFKDQIAKKKLSLQFDNRIENDIIMSDRNRIRQVLINLVSNAQKFTLQGSIKLSVEAKVVNMILEIYFHVVDTGIGMTADEQSRLHSLLLSGVPARQKISSNTAGFGLGLFISNKIAEVLSQKRFEKGGGLRFESQSNKGFHCWFWVQNQSVSPLIKSNSKTPLIMLHKKVVIDTRQTQIISRVRLERIDCQPMHEKFSLILGLKDVSKSEPLKSDQEIRLRRPHNGLRIAKELIQAVQKTSKPMECDSVNHECTKAEQVEREKYFKGTLTNARVSECHCPIILIVDDEQINIMAMQLMLDQLKLSADYVFNGQECVNLIYSQQKKTCCVRCVHKQYELIFMDINMPIMDGVEASKQIKKRFTPVIIACTAYTDNETKDRCYSNGMDYYLAKPVKKDQLYEVLQFYNFL